MIAGPALPDGSAEALGRAKDLVAGFGSGAILPPSPPILADGDDRGAAALQDRGVAAARVERAVSGHGADRLIGRDLVQEIRQNGTVTLVAGGSYTSYNVCYTKLLRTARSLVVIKLSNPLKMSLSPETGAVPPQLSARDHSPPVV